MIVIEEDKIKEIGFNWDELFEVIRETTRIMNTDDYSQPIKPYLDFKDPANRIIAMPAYVGGSIDISGIKWIASFPENINCGIPRANSITILNSTKTGVPLAIFNTTILSIIRTSSVTGVIIDEYLKLFNKKVNVAIIGFGPIGQMHYKMLNDYFANKINNIRVYDLRDIKFEHNKLNTVICNSWEEAYDNADIVITTTASKERYINKKPKEKSLLANISLRDYTNDIYEYVKDGIIVDNWEEVCRKNTDIEKFHEKEGLDKENTYTILDTMNGKVFNNKALSYMFNPMGMSSYDVTIANYYYKKINEIN